MVAHTCKPSIQEAEAGDHKVEVILGCIKKEKESRVGGWSSGKSACCVSVRTQVQILNTHIKSWAIGLDTVVNALTPALRMQRQEDLCEFKNSRVYREIFSCVALVVP